MVKLFHVPWPCHPSWQQSTFFKPTLCTRKKKKDKMIYKVAFSLKLFISGCNTYWLVFLFFSFLYTTVWMYMCVFMCASVPVCFLEYSFTIVLLLHAHILCISRLKLMVISLIKKYLVIHFKVLFLNFHRALYFFYRLLLSVTDSKSINVSYFLLTIGNLMEVSLFGSFSCVPHSLYCNACPL